MVDVLRPDEQQQPGAWSKPRVRRPGARRLARRGGVGFGGIIMPHPKVRLIFGTLGVQSKVEPPVGPRPPRPRRRTDRFRGLALTVGPSKRRRGGACRRLRFPTRPAGPARRWTDAEMAAARRARLRLRISENRRLRTWVHGLGSASADVQGAGPARAPHPAAERRLHGQPGRDRRHRRDPVGAAVGAPTPNSPRVALRVFATCWATRRPQEAGSCMRPRARLDITTGPHAAV